LKQSVLFAAAVVFPILGLVVPVKTLSRAGSWQVDAGHSDAQLTTDGTTDFGKTKMTFTVGAGRVNGTVKLDNNDPANSAFDFRIYPATSMAPPINEAGKFMSHWLSNIASHMLICFHSKGFVKTPDGRLQTSGNLTLTRVDRNVDAAPSAAYAGPVSGDPVIHRISREARSLSG
jgi:polyisoprenoid-binding protein YceI